MSVVGNRIPVIGGATSEDSTYTFSKTFQFCDWKTYSNAFVCGVMGGRLKLGIAVKHALTPMKGTSMLITKAGPRTIKELNDKPAVEVSKKLGLKPPGLLGLYDPMGDFYWLKSWYAIEGENLVVNAPVTPNSCICSMETTKNNQIKTAGVVAQEAVEDSNALKIGAVFAVNCVGRHRACGEDAIKQYEEIRKSVGDKAVIGGFHGYGEHGAPKNCITGFHNMTLPLLVVSDELLT